MKSRLILSILCISFISSIFSQIPTQGLVLYLPLNGNAKDSSSYYNHGTIHGTIPIIDRSGNANKAMYFNGNSYINIPASTSLNLTKNKSISCWLYIPSNETQNWYPTIIHKDEPIKSCTYSLYLSDYYGYYTNQYKAAFLFASNNDHYQSFTNQVYTNYKDKWLHLVGTYDSISGYSKIYFNGQISDSVYVGNKSSNSSNLDLFIGCGKSNGYYSQTFFKGGMDDILIYDRALSAQEIYQIYTEKLIVNAGSNKTIVCGEPVKLDSVTTNYTGKGILKYKWTPSTNLNNDTIPNPTSSTTNSITYTITVTTPDSSSIASGKVSVSPKSFSTISNSTAYKYLTCGESIKFDTILTNYSGMGKLKYKWTPSIGLSSDTIARPICSTTESKYYTVSITTPTGCSASSYVSASVYSNTQYYTTNKTVSCGDTIKLEAVVPSGQNKANLHYKWYPITGLNSDTISNPVARLSNSTSYSYAVTTASGCVVSTGNVYVTFTKTSKPEIKYLNVDNDMNVITWDKSLYSGASSFNIYKETSVANSYSKIATVVYDKAGIFTDSLSSAKVQSNKYKLSILDKCGFETDLSDYHKTMHLSINRGVNTVWNLIWEPYEGFTVSTYNIYRGTSVNEISLIGSISGGNTQFSDYTAPIGDVYYQIEAVKSTPTSIKEGLEKSNNVIISSKSNIATNANNILGLEELNADLSNFSIYPNPTKDNFVIDIESQTPRNSLKIKIYNLTGEIIKTNILQHNKQNVDISNLPNGIYYLELSSDASILGKKLLIKK